MHATPKTETKPAMHIVELQAENFKRLRAVTIRPDGHTVVVGGRNGQGKTSALDAIWAALAGAKGIPPQPIREGEGEAMVRVDLGEIVVTRRFAGKGSRLEVAARNGSVFRSPQAVLDRLVGELSFDPLAFMRAKPREQSETLRQVVGLDLTEIDGRMAGTFTERASANQIVSQRRALYEQLPDDGEPGEDVSVAELMQRLDAARDHNRRRERWETQIDELEAVRTSQESAIEAIRAKIAKAQAEIKALADDVADGDERIADARRTLASMVEVDVEPLTQAIYDAEETNTANRARKHRAWLAVQLADARADAKLLTDELEAARTERARLIAEAEYPIPGLAVTDDGVTYNGIPLEQASGAEQIRVSAAIGLALNPALRVLLIRDGSLLDEQSLAALVEQAEAVDAQLWIERVGDGGASVVIEDGEVRQ